MDEVLKDARFAHVAKDPKFRRIPKFERKIKIDKRFQSMFNDKKFSVTYTIDKRGRPMTQTSSENLRKYYDMSNSEDESDNESSASKTTEETRKKEKVKKLDKKKKKETDNEEESDDEVSTAKTIKESRKKEKVKKQGEKVKKKETDKIKKIQIKQKDSEDEDLEEASSDDDSSTGGKLLPIIKPKEESDADSEEHSKSESEADTENEVEAETAKVDIDRNEKQLQIRRKNESINISDKVKEKLKDLTINYARGEGVLLTDSSSDEESSEHSDEDEIEHKWGELDKGAETTEEITHRLALCNMDWDRIRAIDLMVLFNSFLPSGGLIRSVTIYPSEFGQQRMKEEELNGPRELTETKKTREMDDENDDEEGSEYHREKLRQYQLNRLKYYYAVIDFDTAETANKVYTECDGLEYESTATKLDLRFVPDDMEFDQTPKEACDEIPEFSKYEPRQFITTALQQVKVRLTWDETNPERQEFAQKLNSGKLEEISENDLQAYLASETSDEESEKEEDKPQKDENDSEAETNADPIEKYKSLLKDIEEQEELKKKKDVELEFTWGLGAKEKAEKLVQERLKKDESLTPFEQYLEKRKAKKKAKREERKKLREEHKEAGTDSEDDMVSDTDGKSAKKLHGKEKTLPDDDDNDDGSISSENEDEERRKAELELLLMDDNESNDKQHFNMKKIEENATMTKSKQKRLSKKKNGQSDLKEDEFEVNVADPRFNALFTSHHYNIDPTDPHFRKTKGSDALIKEKLKRRAEESNDVVEAKLPKADNKLDTELQSLVKSVKRNTKNISRPIK